MIIPYKVENIGFISLYGIITEPLVAYFSRVFHSKLSIESFSYFVLITEMPLDSNLRDIINFVILPI